MSLLLLLGGARSGKSDLAVRLAGARAAPVVLVATAEAHDADMAGRIARHRVERPTHWSTLEEPRDLTGALASRPVEETVIVDCLTLWVSNLLLGGAEETSVLASAAQAAALARSRAGLTIAVSNEVGMGVVPDTPLGRRYRDLLGRVNVTWAGAADRACLLVAGRLLELAPSASLSEGLA